MQRLQQLDAEVLRLLDAIRNLVPLSTQFGTQGTNPEMGNIVEMAIRSLAELHRQKMEILRNMNRDNEALIHAEQGQVYSPPIRHEFAEMDYSDEDEDDAGPMQLADLMETDESPVSQIGSPEHVQHTEDGTNWTQFVDGEWANLEQDWTDAQPENLPSEEDDMPIHQNITVRPMARSTLQCVRKMVYTVEPRLLREPSENDCNVCFEKQMMIDTCVTSCNHHFCKGCFVQWENACGGVVTCPTCRTERPIVTEYRSRSVV